MFQAAWNVEHTKNALLHLTAKTLRHHGVKHFEVVQTLTRYHENDYQVIETFQDLIANRQRPVHSNNDNNKNDKNDDVKANVHRGQSKATAIRFWLQESGFPCDNASSIQQMQYLDIGCGDGIVTDCIANKLGFSMDNTYGVDVDQWQEFSHSNTERLHQFRNFKYIKKEDKCLPFESNKFDLITCLMTIHHWEQDLETIQDMARILKPGGLLVVREHDCTDDKIAGLIDIEHVLHAVVIHQHNFHDYMRHYIGQYRSISTLCDEMKDAGLQFIHQSQPQGPTRYTWVVFRKPV